MTIILMNDGEIVGYDSRQGIVINSIEWILTPGFDAYGIMLNRLE